MATNSAIFGFSGVCERDMDFLLAEEIECDPSFREWLIRHTGGPSETGVVVHELGYSITTDDGETDLLFVHSGQGGAKRALMIENKISAPFMPQQPERYRKRGTDGVRNGNWDEFVTVLIAPRKRLAAVADDAFDYQISYEDCESALGGSGPRREFKRRLIRAAYEKAESGWVLTVDQPKTEWYFKAHQLAQLEFPDLPLPPEGKGRAKNSKWLNVKLPEFPSSRFLINIRPEIADVEIYLTRVGVNDLRREFSKLLPHGAEMTQHKSGKSSSISIKHAALDLAIPFPGQEASMRPLFESAVTLMHFARQHRSTIMTLLGYSAQQG